MKIQFDILSDILVRVFQENKTGMCKGIRYCKCTSFAHIFCPWAIKLLKSWNIGKSIYLKCRLGWKGIKRRGIIEDPKRGNLTNVPHLRVDTKVWTCRVFNAYSIKNSCLQINNNLFLLLEHLISLWLDTVTHSLHS